MKLTTAWVDQTQNQLKVQAIPEDHPATRQLHKMFGEHTFFVGTDGLLIAEQSESASAGSDARIDPDPSGREALEIVKVARWGDEERTTLEAQEPELVGVVVVSEPDGDGRL